MDYKKAGVDIEAGYRSVELMKEHVKKTMRPEVLGGLGGFSGAFSMEKFKEMEKNFSEMKETFTKENLEGFEKKFNELNDVIKGLKQDYAASKEEVTAAEEFASMLERRTGKEIIFQDERLTTVEAYEIMDLMGIKKEERYDYVDMVAAKVILEDYLNR